MPKFGKWDRKNYKDIDQVPLYEKLLKERGIRKLFPEELNRKKKKRER